MSHITEVKLKVRDLDALKAAADRLGFEFIENQKTHHWYGQYVGDSVSGAAFARERGVGAMGTCEHALRAKDHQGGEYEIGVVKSIDGDGFSLVYDDFGPGQKLVRRAGRNMETLKQEYAVEVATTKAKTSLRGWSVKREDLEGGRVRLRLRKR